MLFAIKQLLYSNVDIRTHRRTTCLDASTHGCTCTEHALIYAWPMANGQFLHGEVRVDGRLATTTRTSPGLHCVDALDRFCNGLYCHPSIPYCTVCAHFWFTSPTHGTSSSIVEPCSRRRSSDGHNITPLQLFQNDALRLEQMLFTRVVYNTLSIAWHLTFSCSQSSTPSTRYTHTLIYSDTKRHKTPLTAIPSILSCIGA